MIKRLIHELASRADIGVSDDSRIVMEKVVIADPF
jgi:hypothetical protein